MYTSSFCLTKNLHYMYVGPFLYINTWLRPRCTLAVSLMYMIFPSLLKIMTMVNIMMMNISSLKDDVDDHRVDDYDLLVPGQNKNEAVEGLEKVGAQLTRLQHLRNIKIQQIPDNL